MISPRYGKVSYMLDQVKVTACSRNQHVVGHRGEIVV